MEKLNPKQIIKACRLSFQGDSDEKVAKKIKVHKSTIIRWRKLELWQKMEQQLLEAAMQEETEKALKA